MRKVLGLLLVLVLFVPSASAQLIDEDNDLLEFFALLGPVIIFGLLILWTERVGHWLWYVLTIYSGAVAVATLWDEISTWFLFILVGIVVLVVYRMIEAARGFEE